MHRPHLTQQEAADAAGVSVSTIRRRRETGALPGAWRDTAGAWRIPVDDLLAAGMRLHAPAGPDDQGVPEPRGSDAHQEPRELREVRAELDAERVRRQRAEERAEALREAVTARDAHVEDLRHALRALTAGSAAPGELPAGGGQHSGGGGQEQRQLREGSGPRGRRWWWPRRR